MQVTAAWILVVSTATQTTWEGAAPARFKWRCYGPCAVVQRWAKPGAMDAVSPVLRKVTTQLLTERSLGHIMSLTVYDNNDDKI